MVNEDIGRFLKSLVRRDRSIRDDLKIELLVIGLLLDTPVLDCPIDLPDGGIDSIHGNGPDRSVLIPHLLGGHEAAALGDGQRKFESD